MDSLKDSDNKNEHSILKGLLNQQDDDKNKSDSRSSTRGLGVRSTLSSTLDSMKNANSGGNNMEDEERKLEPQSHVDSLLHSLGFKN
ncbi:hypothetical protein FQA39_LY03394 [Lamprigera yunnana]|nr:hypothetical protein FQA39_LY03394 [Lamprigera yunnana]